MGNFKQALAMHGSAVHAIAALLQFQARMTVTQSPLFASFIWHRQRLFAFLCFGVCKIKLGQHWAGVKPCDRHIPGKASSAHCAVVAVGLAMLAATSQLTQGA